MKRLLSIALTLALSLSLLTCARAYAHEPVTPTEDEYPISGSYLLTPFDESTDPTDPSDPTNPSDPSDPTDPSEPEEPTEPEDPTDPSEPEDPTDPTDPDDPGDEPEPVVLPFTDVRETHWFYGDVCFVYANGIMNGMSETQFMPDRTLTRGEVVTVLYRVSGQPETLADCPFSDVPSGEYYFTPVLWAAENGIVNGVTETTFCPKDPITREQIATIFFRYYAIYLEQEVSFSGDLTTYPDHDAVHDYATDALSWAVGCELMRGIASGSTVTLSPRATTTRAQLAALLTRLCAMDGVMDSGNGGSGSDGGNEDEDGEDENKFGQSSPEIIEFIKGREGFRANPYWDYSQWSVGYGTCCRDEDGNRVTSRADEHKIADKYRNLTVEAAEQLLMESLAEEYEPTILGFADKHGLEFTQNQFDALVSFTYNLGGAWTSSSYKISRLLSGKEEYANGWTDLDFMEAYGSWCRVGGKVATGTCDRRLREAAIFLYGDYGYENPRFAFVRYDGNGSYLTTSNSTGNIYTDAVDYFTIGEPYGELLTPEWVAADDEDTSNKVFLGWFTGDGAEVTGETIVKSNCTLIAKWGNAES